VSSTSLAFSSTGGSISVPIAANVPAGTYTGVLNFMNSSSCTGSTSISFTVTPLPTLASVSQPSALCFNPVTGTNANILLTGLLANTTQTATYSINNGPAQTVTFTSVGTSATVSIPVLAANNGQLLTISSINCANFTSNNSVVLNIINSPNAPSVSASSSTINVGGSVSITGVLSNSANSMQWFNVATGGTAIALNNNPVDQTAFNTTNIPINFCTPNITTTYYVQETDALTNCPSARTPFTITTNPLFTNSPSNLLICQSNGSVTMTVNVVPSTSTPIVWQSSTNGTFPGTVVTPSSNPSILTVSPNSTTHYQVSSMLPMGCPNNPTGNLLFNVGVLSPVTLAATATPQVFCAGQNQAVTLSANLTGGNFTVSSISHNPASIPSNLPVSNTLVNNGVTNTNLSGGTLDDGGWGNIPIGFTFNYFGSNFTTLGVGTNGLVMFGTIPGYTNAVGQLGQYNFSSPTFPNSGNPGNIIGLMLSDMDFRFAGNLRYWTDGIAPTIYWWCSYHGATHAL
jgi:hypothetical protein